MPVVVVDLVVLVVTLPELIVTVLVDNVVIVVVAHVGTLAAGAYNPVALW